MHSAKLLWDLESLVLRLENRSSVCQQFLESSQIANVSKFTLLTISPWVNEAQYTIIFYILFFSSFLITTRYLGKGTLLLWQI